jgi:aerobic carbon-monoxide dehydrogenase medium subunit
VIPATFEYVRAESRTEAFDALADPDASVVAGGHSLVPMMKLRLATPSRLVDIAPLDFRGVQAGTNGGDAVRIGALTTYDEVLRTPAVRGLQVLYECCASVGDLQVRNAGTLGGGLAHADPAGDLAAGVLALETRLVLDSPSGPRQVEAEDFITGPFTTAIREQELLVELVVPPQPDGQGSAYVSVPDPASGYPLAGAAVRVRCQAGRMIGCTIGLTGAATRPLRARAAEALLLEHGSVPPTATIRHALEGLNTVADVAADGEYRRHLAAVVIGRAASLARRRAEEASWR